MSYDLRTFFAELGGVRAHTLGTPSNERKDTTATVEMLDEDCAEIVCDPLKVIGYADGIQASSCIAYRGHRPIYLSYVAAGCVDENLNLVEIAESLFLLCSTEDADYLLGVSQGIPVQTVNETDPMEVERLVREAVQENRDRLEHKVIQKVASLGPVLVDGELQHYKHTNLVGVAKTLGTRYLPDESVLLGLPQGWRSPRFSITHQNNTTRYSCYLRLLNAGEQSWNYGLVRLEVLDETLLEPLAALCLKQSQNATSNDPRFDRHLKGVRGCEQVLKARKPAAFSRLRQS